MSFDNSGVNCFRGDVATAGIGASIVAAPAVYAVGQGLAVFGGWSATGYAAAAWTGAWDIGANGAIFGGMDAYGMGDGVYDIMDVPVQIISSDPETSVSAPDSGAKSE